MSEPENIDMRSQGSSDNYSASSGASDADDDIYHYGCDLDDDMEPAVQDSEYFDYKCLSVQDVEKLLNEAVEVISSKLKVSPSTAKQILHTHSWNVEKIIEKHQKDSEKVLIDAKVKVPDHIQTQAQTNNNTKAQGGGCLVCLETVNEDMLSSLSCQHMFCKSCWVMHLETQLKQGVSTVVQCMWTDCFLVVPEDFVLAHLMKPDVRKKYQTYAFNDYVKSHPQLRFCPGPGCEQLIRAKEYLAKKSTCYSCHTSFCFKCGCDYHAPTDCDVIKQWLGKCADDSETANYISAHTKDCPKCHICIEKNGGCNHMQCFKCKHDFCWMCLGDWKAHGSEYYECSRYKENPNIATESVNAQAREALRKYLFYFERWENHAKSLKLEEQTSAKIQEKIEEKILSPNSGTWIDWQYLLKASALLAKCRYTLQYTYPYAYFMAAGARKELFEYQQAQLEAEIENLSWKIERAETHSRGDIENQMDICEKSRSTLLRDFLNL